MSDGASSYSTGAALRDRIFQRQIEKDLFDRVPVGLSNPRAIVFGGQAGSGREAGVSSALQEFRDSGNAAAAVIGSDLRAYHPDFALLLTQNDKTATMLTDKDVANWVEKSIQTAISKRSNVVIDGSMRDPKKVEQTLRLLKTAGYEVEVRVMAVHESISKLGVLERYEKQKHSYGFGIMSPLAKHDASYSGVVASLKAIEDNKLADMVVVMRKSGERIYVNHIEGNYWRMTPASGVETLRAERARPFTRMEVERFTDVTERLEKVLNQPSRAKDVENKAMLASAISSAKPFLPELKAKELSHAEKWENYFYKENPNVLINVKNIRDAAVLKDYEAKVVTLRRAQLEMRPIKGNYDLAHLQAMHKHLFQDVYPWAGQLRTVNMEKGKGFERTVFTPVDRIEKLASKIPELGRDKLLGQNLSKEQVVDRISKLYAHMNEVHPFREGNGRSPRAFVSQIAGEAGYVLNFNKVEKQHWIGASVEASRGENADLGSLRKILGNALESKRGIAFDTLSKEEALKTYPELKGAFNELSHAKTSGESVPDARKRISEQVHRGLMSFEDSTPQEFAHLGKLFGVQVHEQAKIRPGGVQGQILYVGDRHALLGVYEGHAIALEKNALNKSVSVGDKLDIRRFDKGVDKFRVSTVGNEIEKDYGQGQELTKYKPIDPRR